VSADFRLAGEAWVGWARLAPVGKWRSGRAEGLPQRRFPNAFRLKLLSTTLKYVPHPALDEPSSEPGTRLTVKLSRALVIEASGVKAAGRS